MRLLECISDNCATGLLRSPHRKDDYAFFLQPVDVTQVPNYLEVIKDPMDLGTMTTKVEEGRYRSLDEFTVSSRVSIL